LMVACKARIEVKNTHIALNLILTVRWLMAHVTRKLVLFVCMRDAFKNDFVLRRTFPTPFLSPHRKMY
jgi:hypothetical protein